MEAFIAYTPNDDIRTLAKTLEAWELDDIEPVAIQCQQAKFEITRRVAAENMAQGDYLLVDIGCLPKKQAVRKAIKILYNEEGSPVGMVGLTGVRVCRHRVVDKWPTKRTPSYDEEHREAYRMKGYRVVDCTKPLYKRSNVI